MGKIFKLLAVSLIALLLASCTGGGLDNSPKSIEKAIYTQFQKGNYEKGAEIFFDNLAKESGEEQPTAEEKAESIKAFTQKTKESFAEKGGIESFEIVKETFAEDGLTAEVETKFVFGNGTQDTTTTQYVKQDNVWKITLSFGK
ncbi:MAG: DUF4878 domain-containing protein [Bacteroidales bacterium]|jgi:uncharacterized membrane protein YgcG|nr:DUF4878 domain-containing protein [Bacteroidales bacterium]